jgi:DNA-binding response OmpR family regulator/DNA-binding CsgD family transcriptional regulator
MAEAGPSETILVVDDSPESLGFLVEALESDGRAVLVARSGAAALKAAALSRPDVILLDAVMPEMDGFETCRRLKLLPELAPVPVIFMTGLTETEHVVHALDSGGVDYLTKPIDVDELRARIRVHLANARRANSARIALDATGRHLVAFSPAAEVLWATPQAQRLFGEQLSTLGDHVKVWAERQGGIESLTNANGEAGAPDGSRLRVTGLGRIGPDEYLFQLSPTGPLENTGVLRARFGLTGREAEVLVWIARGKSNKDIGDILGLSPRTVNKHLEQIYAKLGVENRSSAAIAALQALG